MFSEQVLEHYQTPHNQGVLEAPSGSGLGGCLEMGQWLRIQVLLEQERIRDARFLTIGCVSAIAAGSYLTQWAQGRSLSEAHEMSSERLAQELGGLPPTRHFCAQMAVQALRAALADASGGQRQRHAG